MLWQQTLCVLVFMDNIGWGEPGVYGGGILRFSDPWRGPYFTALEGWLRVSFNIRWPVQIPAGKVSNEIVHEMDFFPTLAHVPEAQTSAQPYGETTVKNA